MSDSDRCEQGRGLGAFGYVAALVLCCFIVGILSYGLGRENDGRYTTPAAYAQSAKADAQATCVGREGSSAFECIYDKVEAAQEQARGEQDLSAQQKAANAAMLSMFIAFGALLATSLGVFYVKRTLEASTEAVKETAQATKAMRNANEIARDANRPWIQISCEPIHLDAEGSPMHAHFQTDFKNIGNTVARHISYESACFIFDPDDETVAVPWVTAKWQEMSNRGIESSLALMPGETASIRSHNSQIKTGSSSDMNCAIAAIARYKFTGEDDWHTTEVSFLMGRDECAPRAPLSISDIARGKSNVIYFVRRLVTGRTD